MTVTKKIKIFANHNFASISTCRSKKNRATQKLSPKGFDFFFFGVASVERATTQLEITGKGTAEPRKHTRRQTRDKGPTKDGTHSH